MLTEVVYLCWLRALLAVILQEPKQKQPVIVAGKDVKEVDNDYFLIPVKIMDHEGPLKTSFPIENRLLPQGVATPAIRPAAEMLLCDTHILCHTAQQQQGAMPFGLACSKLCMLACCCTYTAYPCVCVWLLSPIKTCCLLFV